MDTSGTPYRKSWGLYFQSLILFWILGPAMAYAGYYMVQTSEIIVVIIGGLMLLCGPIMVLAGPFMPRPGYGNCPSCGKELIFTLKEGDPGSLCPQCAAYTRVQGDRVQLEAIGATHEKPVYAAALPWGDIAGVHQNTISFSAQDYLTDTFNGWLAKKEQVRVLDQWPRMCCVCGGNPTRNQDHAVTVLLMGRMRETQCVIAAKGVPYCADHKDGVDFAKPDYAMGIFAGSSAPHSFAIKFRSHAFREGFRKLNPHKFPTEAQGPLKIRRLVT